ncbi:Protein TWK-4, partial [Aphelenchoides avenae]
SSEFQDVLKEIELEQLDVTEIDESIEFAIDNLIRTAMEAFEEGLKPSDLHATHENSTRSKWTYRSALFFAATVLTTIGYGSLVPISFYGRLFCIAYAVIGIPLMLITIADLAKFFSDLVVKAKRKWKCRKEQPDGSDRRWQQIENLREN